MGSVGLPADESCRAALGSPASIMLAHLCFAYAFAPTPSDDLSLARTSPSPNPRQALLLKVPGELTISLVLSAFRA